MTRPMPARRRLAAVALCAGIAAHAPSMSQVPAPPAGGPGLPAPYASHGGRAELSPPRPIAESADPVNLRVATDTVDGLVLAITIDGPTVILDAAVPARVSSRQARGHRATEGPRVKVTAFAGGQVVSTAMLPDNLINASEGGATVRIERRQLAFTLAVDRPVDTVTVEAPATAASGTLDVRPAYARICEADPHNKWCPRDRP